MKIEENKYVTPAAKVVEFSLQSILCESGNQSMREVDLGDGGFTEE